MIQVESQYFHSNIHTLQNNMADHGQSGFLCCMLYLKPNTATILQGSKHHL